MTTLTQETTRWPGSVIELLEVVGPLTDPTSHGGNAEAILGTTPGSWQ